MIIAVVVILVLIVIGLIVYNVTKIQKFKPKNHKFICSARLYECYWRNIYSRRQNKED